MKFLTLVVYGLKVYESEMSTYLRSNGVRHPLPCKSTAYHLIFVPTSWLRGTVAEGWSLTGELSLSHARPAADG